MKKKQAISDAKLYPVQLYLTEVEMGLLLDQATARNVAIPQLIHERIATLKVKADVEIPPAKQSIKNKALIFSLIEHERARQNAKFGDMPRNLTPSAWLTVLIEEVGEIARAIIEGDSDNYETELVQVAAVTVAALEDYFQGTPDKAIEAVCPLITYQGCIPTTTS